MIKRFIKVILISMLFFIAMGIYSYAEVNGTLENEAIIQQAYYQRDELILKVEIDEKVYQGQFDREISYEEYLFFHHNEGILVRIKYTFNGPDQILIFQWALEK